MNLRRSCFRLLFSIILSLELESIKSECDIEALRCDVICFFPELSQHCNTCGVRRPMRFGKRSYSQIPQNLFIFSEQKNEKISKISDQNPEFLKFSNEGSNTEGSKSILLRSPISRSPKMKELLAFTKQIPEFLDFPNEFSNTEDTKSLLLGFRVSRSPKWKGKLRPDDVKDESRRKRNELKPDKNHHTRIRNEKIFGPITNLKDIFPSFINKEWKNFFKQKSNFIDYIKHFRKSPQLFQKSPQLFQKSPQFFSKFRKLREIKRNLSVLTSKELNTQEMISGIKNIMDMQSLPLDPMNYGWKFVCVNVKGTKYSGDDFGY
ncbi:hypothetical protein Anas_01655 [Armadillidium nasatum]|uniref:Uncharacterized protein n=1 Tax=Armadillidium nasatum TaxID=96803 RepID=A0A5N5TG59_9CRUS|nr:hypothetical protein Anas_01655 [Armadillidium nasatum]